MRVRKQTYFINFAYCMNLRKKTNILFIKNQNNMRKSFIYMFMMVMTIVSVGVVSSCKDYDEDNYIELTNENSSLRALLEHYKSLLDQKIADLEKAQENCEKTCSIARSLLEKRISDLETAMDTKADKATVDNLKGQVETLQNTVSGLQTTVSNIQSTITTIQGDIATINSTLTTVQGDISTIKNTLTTIQGDIATINGKITTIEGNITTIQTDITNIKGDITTIKGDIATINSTLTTVQGDITNIKNDITNIKGDITTINSKLTQVISDAAEALERAKNDSTWIKNLEGVVKENNNKTNTRIDSLNNWLDGYKNDIQTAFNNYDEAIRFLKERNTIISDSLVKLDKNVKDLKDSLIVVEDRMNTRIDSLKNVVEENKQKIQELDTKVQDALGRLDKLEDAHKKLITGIVLNEAINPVFGTFNLPADVRSNILFGYWGTAKQSGEFPSVDTDGYYVNNNYALTQADYDMINPTDIYSYNSGDLMVSDGNDGDSLNIGSLYLTVNPTNVDFTGTEFTLVNSLDEKAKATLEPLKPSTHKISFGYTRVGVEGQSPNGFYETQAKIAKADVLDAAIHLEGMETALKKVLDKLKNASFSMETNGDIHFNSGGDLNISDLSMTLYNNIHDMCDANAVKATWTDQVLGQERSVYSQYGLATTAVRHLGGYSSFKDFNYVTFPGYESAISIVDRLASSIKTQIHDAWPIPTGGVSFTMPAFTINSITFDRSQIDINQFVYTKSFDVNIKFHPESGYYLTPSSDKAYLHLYDAADNLVARVPFGNVEYDAVTDTYTITVYRDQWDINVDLTSEMTKVFDAIDKALQDAVDMVDDVHDSIETAIQNMLNDVNGLLNDINNMESSLGSGIDKMANVLKRWITNANTRIVDFINNSNYRLQPIIITTSDEGTYRLSEVKNYPTKVPANTTFVLTNYTYELIAPALKKYVACTNVFKDAKSAQGGDADCISALQAVNAGEYFNKVIDGSNVFIPAEGFRSGYVYEIAISALDYEGMQTTRKFYVGR